MDVLTLYVGQGSLAGVRIGNEGIIVDAHMPENDHVSMAEIKQSLSVYFRGTSVRGLILTGFDSDHAHAGGVEWILSEFDPDWIMYPKYYKDTECAGVVFNSIQKYERRRASTNRPLIRHSMRLDRLDSRRIMGLGRNFTVDLFSPHIQDMDSSNNCSIVAKITGVGGGAFSYLVTGDTETARWDTIAKLFGSDLAADVLAAAHHGALSGVHAKALLDIAPNTVLISAGVDSQYDHPHGRRHSGLSKGGPTRLCDQCRSNGSEPPDSQVWRRLCYEDLRPRLCCGLSCRRPALLCQSTDPRISRSG